MESVGTLHVKKNGVTVSSFELGLGENIIGRFSPFKEKPSTIEIEDDGKLSRQHFIINVNQNEDGTFKFLLRDNNSLNGTQIISGKKKKTLSSNNEEPLLNKDVIRAGEKFFFELEIPTSEEEKTEKSPKPINGRIFVPVTKEGKTIQEMVTCKQILGIKSDGNYAHLYIANGQELWANKNLKYFEDLLRDESYIVRISDKFLINIDIVKSYNVEGKDGRITIIDNVRIDNKNSLVVSRVYKSSFEK